MGFLFLVTADVIAVVPELLALSLKPFPPIFPQFIIVSIHLFLIINFHTHKGETCYAYIVRTLIHTTCTRIHTVRSRPDHIYVFYKRCYIQHACKQKHLKTTINHVYYTDTAIYNVNNNRPNTLQGNISHIYSTNDAIYTHTHDK